MIIDPPALYKVYLSWDDIWVFMEECPDCFAIAPTHLCHRCPDLAPSDWKNDEVELGYLLTQATIFQRVERVAMSA